MPTPYPFVSGATLLASQMNSLSQLPTVSITANSTAVATHAYSRIVANGSAISYTIPNSVFEAGQVIEFHNINSTTCTIAAGAGVTLNAAAALTIEQYQSATIYATSASSFIVFESAVRPGLELVSATTIGSAVSSVQVTGAFSSTYENYLITINSGVASAACDLRLTLGATSSGYYWGFAFRSYGDVGGGGAGSNGAFWLAGVGQPASLMMNCALFNPNLAKNTTFASSFAGAATTGASAQSGGYLADTTQYTAFTITPSTGTLTGGTIRVYGFRN